MVYGNQLEKRKFYLVDRRQMVFNSDLLVRIGIIPAQTMIFVLDEDHVPCGAKLSAVKVITGDLIGWIKYFHSEDEFAPVHDPASCKT